VPCEVHWHDAWGGHHGAGGCGAAAVGVAAHQLVLNSRRFTVMLGDERLCGRQQAVSSVMSKASLRQVRV